MANQRIGLGLIGLLMVTMTILEGAIGVDYTVGDDYGWDVPPKNSSDFYSIWANRYEFKVGDVAVFRWTGSRKHTAAEVPDKADFDSCNISAETTPLAGGDAVGVRLNTEGVHYFICNIGTHCEQGQKVALNVTADASSSSASKPHPTHVFALSIALSAMASFLFVH
ncbi:hypothetical protein PTKIN_Ptkin19aG0044200 [Pterospermum kingtungense]